MEGKEPSESARLTRCVTGCRNMLRLALRNLVGIMSREQVESLDLATISRISSAEAGWNQDNDRGL